MMKQKKALIFFLSMILIASLIACNGRGEKGSDNQSVAQGSGEGISQNDSGEGVSASEPADEEQSEEVKGEDNFSNLPAVDENVYGNTIGNLYSNGLMRCLSNPAGGMLVAPPSNGCMYLFSDMKMYDDCFMTEKECERPENLNYKDGTIYFSSKAWGLQAYGGEEGKLTMLRIKGASYLQCVNDNLYYTDPGTAKLYTMSLEDGEETLLCEERVFYPVVYKNLIVFQMDSDKESIYSMSLENGRLEKINDIRSYGLIVYEDYVYYYAIDENNDYSLRRIRLDGSDETVLVQFGQRGPYIINLNNGYFYYVADDTADVINYLDLSEANPKPQILDINGQLEKVITDSKNCKFFEIKNFDKLILDQEYMFLGTICYNMDSGDGYGACVNFADVLYNMETGEMTLLRKWVYQKRDDITHKKEDVVITQGTVSNRDKIEEGISKLPPKIYQKFADRGWHVVLTDDARFDAGAVTYYSEHIIYVPDRLGDKIPDALLHEVGHFISSENAIPYESEEFKKIYAAEKEAFCATGGMNAQYCDNEMDYFAQVFADIYSTGLAESAAPKSYEFVLNCVKKVEK